MEAAICLPDDDTQEQIITLTDPKFITKCLDCIKKGICPLYLSTKNIDPHTYTSIRVKLESLDLHVEHRNDIMTVNTRKNYALQLLSG